VITTSINSFVFAQPETTVHVVNNLTHVGVFVTIPTTGVQPTVGSITPQSQEFFGPYMLNKTRIFTVFDARYIHGGGFGTCENQDNLIGSDVTVIITEEKWVDKNINIICSVKTGVP
jgi:hypothetical protein